VRVIGDYADHSEWWEILVKPAIASICKDFSSKLAKERKCTKRFLYASLKIFLRQENWAEVARAKESIRRMLVCDMTGAQKPYDNPFWLFGRFIQVIWKAS
jgi:hypothetical protein